MHIRPEGEWETILPQHICHDNTAFYVQMGLIIEESFMLFTKFQSQCIFDEKGYEEKDL